MIDDILQHEASLLGSNYVTSLDVDTFVLEDQYPDDPGMFRKPHLWCISELGYLPNVSIKVRVAGGESLIAAEFRNETDAVLFKLRWKGVKLGSRLWYA